MVIYWKENSFKTHQLLEVQTLAIWPNFVYRTVVFGLLVCLCNFWVLWMRHIVSYLSQSHDSLLSTWMLMIILASGPWRPFKVLLTHYSTSKQQFSFIPPTNFNVNALLGLTISWDIDRKVYCSPSLLYPTLLVILSYGSYFSPFWLLWQNIIAWWVTNNLN